MRHSHQPGIDSESLQADVMRFMAIIAFCLIAILALVRNVEAPPTAVPADLPAPAEAPQPASTEAVAIPASAPIIAPRVATAPRQSKPEPKPEPKPAPKPTPIVRLPDTTAKPFLIAPSKPLEPALPITLMEPIKPQQAPEIAAAPPPEAPEQTPAEAAPERPAPMDAVAAKDAVAAAEPGLSLRFTSDRDFLRLVSKGDVRVFLFDQQRSFELSRSYRFDAASPPGQLYEVLPETIPAAIGRAAQGNLQRHPELRWGLSMPAPIQRQIAEYVAAVDTGELRIDRFGEVHHVQNR
jgi:hypothetical protein